MPALQDGLTQRMPLDCCDQGSCRPCAALLAARQPIGRIRWTGAESADAGLGHIDGAIRSGERSVQEVSASPVALRDTRDRGLTDPQHSGQMANALTLRPLTGDKRALIN